MTTAPRPPGHAGQNPPTRRAEMATNTTPTPKSRRPNGDPEPRATSGTGSRNTTAAAWWLWSSTPTSRAVIYTILYPAWPLVKGAAPGLLGFSTRADAAEVSALRGSERRHPHPGHRAEVAAITARREPRSLLTRDPGRNRPLFATWCSQCHGQGAAGEASGNPTCSTTELARGGTIDDIHTTISHPAKRKRSWSGFPPEMTRSSTEKSGGREIASVVQ